MKRCHLLAGSGTAVKYLKITFSLKSFKTFRMITNYLLISPQAAHHQVEGVFFKRQKLLVSQNTVSRDLTLSALFLKIRAIK